MSPEEQKSRWKNQDFTFKSKLGKGEGFLYDKEVRETPLNAGNYRINYEAIDAKINVPDL